MPDPAAHAAASDLRRDMLSDFAVQPIVVEAPTSVNTAVHDLSVRKEALLSRIEERHGLIREHYDAIREDRVELDRIDRMLRAAEGPRRGKNKTTTA